MIRNEKIKKNKNGISAIIERKIDENKVELKKKTNNAK